MNEKVLIIISVITVIVLIILISVNCSTGRCRVSYMNFDNETLALHNQNQPPGSPSYIVFTTIPSRLRTKFFAKNLKRRLKIAGDSVVVLNVPHKSLKGQDYIIPPEILALQGPKFMIHRCKDLGPITKIIPSLETDSIPEKAIIMVCDDDITYLPRTFSLLRASIIKNPNAVSSMCNDTIEGYKAYGFIKKIMKGLTELSIPKACQRIDDDVIQQYVKHHNIKVVPVKYPGHFSGEQTDSFGNYGWAACSCYSTPLEPHPEWEELRSDNRVEIRKNCIPLLLENLRK